MDDDAEIAQRIVVLVQQLNNAASEAAERNIEVTYETYDARRIRDKMSREILSAKVRKVLT